MPHSVIERDGVCQVLWKSDKNIRRRNQSSEPIEEISKVLTFQDEYLAIQDQKHTNELHTSLSRAWICGPCNQLCLVGNKRFSSSFKNSVSAKKPKGVLGRSILYTTLNNESKFYNDHLKKHKEKEPNKQNSNTKEELTSSNSHEYFSNAEKVSSDSDNCMAVNIIPLHQNTN